MSILNFGTLVFAADTLETTRPDRYPGNQGESKAPLGGGTYGHTKDGVLAYHQGSPGLVEDTPDFPKRNGRIHVFQNLGYQFPATTPIGAINIMVAAKARPGAPMPPSKSMGITGTTAPSANLMNAQSTVFPRWSGEALRQWLLGIRTSGTMFRTHGG